MTILYLHFVAGGVTRASRRGGGEGAVGEDRSLGAGAVEKTAGTERPDWAVPKVLADGSEATPGRSMPLRWLAFVTAVLIGSALMVGNNFWMVDEIYGDPDWNELTSTFLAPRCLMSVVAGALSDARVAGLSWAPSHVHMLTAACGAMVLAMLLLSTASTDDPHSWSSKFSLETAMLMCGGSAGVMFVLGPVMALRWFGKPHFPRTYSFLMFAAVAGQVSAGAGERERERQQLIHPFSLRLVLVADGALQHRGHGGPAHQPVRGRRRD